MRKNRIILLSVFLMFIACTNTKDAKSDNIAPPHNTVTDKIQKDELNGFRNIRWGIDMSQLNEFKLIRKGKVNLKASMDEMMLDAKNKGTLREKYRTQVMIQALFLQADGIWIKNNDYLFLGNIKLDNIYYYTVNNKLAGVLLTLDSYEYFSTLKSALTIKYGVEDVINENEKLTMLSWKRPETDIRLTKDLTESKYVCPLTIGFFDAIYSETASEELTKDAEKGIKERKKKEAIDIDNITKDF